MIITSPPHLKDIVALPYETVMLQLLPSSGANTLLKRNVKFGQCFLDLLIVDSFSLLFINIILEKFETFFCKTHR